MKGREMEAGDSSAGKGFACFFFNAGFFLPANFDESERVEIPFLYKKELDILSLPIGGKAR
ncbi:hypothetical protein [Planifilum fimeticola]